MFHKIMLAGFLAASMSVFSSVGAQDKDAEKLITETYHKMDVGMQNRDMKTITSFLNKNFYAKDVEGNVTEYQRAVAELTSLLKVVKPSKVVTHILSIRTSKNTATVMTNSWFIGTGVDPQSKKTSKLKIYTNDRDYWIKTPQGWKIKATINLKKMTVVDGKEIKQTS